MQLIVERLGEQDNRYAAFTEKTVRARWSWWEESSWRQKIRWHLGAIIRQPLGIASMIGV